MLTECNGWRVLGIESKRKTPSGAEIIYYNVECPQCKRIYAKQRCAVLQIKTCRKCFEINAQTYRGEMVGELLPKYLGRIKDAISKRNNRGVRLKNNQPITVTVTLAELWDIFLKQGRKCALTGDDLVLPKTIRDFNKGIGNASIDRIDSSKGYTVDNVQWITKTQQRMKMDLTEADYMLECRKVSNNH